MKGIACFWCLLLVLGASLEPVQAQVYLKEGNAWCFGTNGGLRFMPDSAGLPTPLPGVDHLDAGEGSASIADTAGNLLFYVGTHVEDGPVGQSTLFNRLGEPMPHGRSAIIGGSSSTQNAIIVRKPGSFSEYYVFSVSQIENNASAGQGFYWSKVDMTLDSGRGDLVDSLRNRSIMTLSTEKVTAVQHKNGRWVWVVAHELFTDRFAAVLVTEAGPQPPVFSPVGLWHKHPLYPTSKDVARGAMKLSPDGTHLAVAITADLDGTHYMQVLHFNNETGAVSDPITFTNTGAVSMGPYGTEFSPDNEKVYFTDRQRGLIYQFNLAAGDSAAVADSRLTLQAGAEPMALQLAIDGRIYLTLDYGQATVAYLAHPNADDSAGIGYVRAGITLAGDAHTDRGLPSMNQSILAPLMPRTVGLLPEANDTGFCVKAQPQVQLVVAGHYDPGMGLNAYLSDSSGDFQSNPTQVAALSFPNGMTGRDTLGLSLNLSATRMTGRHYRLRYAMWTTPSVTMDDTVRFAIYNVGATTVTPAPCTQDGYAVYRVPMQPGVQLAWGSSGNIIRQDADSVVIDFGTESRGWVKAYLSGYGCTDTLEAAFVTAIRKAHSLSGRLFPQPTATSARLELAAPLSQSALLTILSPEGKTLRTQSLPTGTTGTLLDVEGWAAGLYMIRLQGSDASGAWNLVKE